MTKPILFLLSFICFHSMAQSNAFVHIDSFDDYVLQLEMAKQNDRMIVVSIIDDNTDEGRQAKSHNQSASLAELASDFQMIEIDIKSALGAQWVQTFPVNVLPTVFFLNKEEVLLDLETGVLNSKRLFNLIKGQAIMKNLYQSLNTKYGQNTLSTDEWIELIRIHGLNFEFYQTSKLALEFLHSLDDEKLREARVLPVLYEYGISLETKYPDFILTNKLLSPDTAYYDYQSWFNRAYGYNLDRAIFNKDTNYLQLVIDPLIEHSQEADIDFLIFETRQLYVSKTSNYQVMYRATIDWTSGIKDSSQRSRFIFDEAFKLADKNEDTLAYATAQKLAWRAGEFSSEFRFKMLEAYCAYKLEDYDACILKANEAKSLTKTAKNLSNANNLIRMAKDKKI